MTFLSSDGHLDADSIAVLNLSWQPLPDFPNLEDNHVHLLSAVTPDSQYECPEITNFITADEMKRASRFKFERHRNQWIHSRIALKKILAKYLDCAPATIEIIGERDTKPQLKTPLSTPLHFNCSHAANQFIVAISSSSTVGVDIEHFVVNDEWQSLAKKCATSVELNLLARLPEEQQINGFLSIWTRKEALGKLLGKGLDYAYHQTTLCTNFANPQFEFLFGTHPVQLTQFLTNRSTLGALATSLENPVLHGYHCNNL